MDTRPSMLGSRARVSVRARARVRVSSHLAEHVGVEVCGGEDFGELCFLLLEALVDGLLGVRGRGRGRGRGRARGSR